MHMLRQDYKTVHCETRDASLDNLIWIYFQNLVKVKLSIVLHDAQVKFLRTSIIFWREKRVQSSNGPTTWAQMKGE
jgi:hypothetical protein